MTILTEIEAQLKEPFALDDIDLLPKGIIERDGKKLCMALPYADPRVYQDRLNQLAPGEWETPAPIALTVGDKLVTYVTVFLCGVVHTDVGEAGPGENQGTEAWSQAFKRACSQFGLGRYLYDLEKEWVPYIAQGKSGKIDLDAAGKQAIVRKMYRRAGILAHAAPATDQSTSLLDEVKASFARLFKPEKWESFKVNVIGFAVPDEGLGDKEVQRLAEKLASIRSEREHAA